MHREVLVVYFGPKGASIGKATDSDHPVQPQEHVLGAKVAMYHPAAGIGWVVKSARCFEHLPDYRDHEPLR